jgi:hypothetical protein
MTFTALPHGCDHIDWQWTNPGADPTHPDLGDLREPLLTQFATWTVQPGGESPELPVRERELAAQGLTFADEPHLCQTDPVTGRELWAVAVAPTGPAGTGPAEA